MIKTSTKSSFPGLIRFEWNIASKNILKPVENNFVTVSIFFRVIISFFFAQRLVCVCECKNPLPIDVDYQISVCENFYSIFIKKRKRN